MQFDSILPERPKRGPDENYDVWLPSACMDDIEPVLRQLLDEAQRQDTPFTPDDLAEELKRARSILARAPYDPPCRWIYEPEGDPHFEPTHVLEGLIVHLWYLVWDDDEFVAICRLEPNTNRGEFREASPESSSS